MKLLKDLEIFLKLMKCYLMNRKEKNMIYMGLMGLKFHLVQLDLTFLMLMIFSKPFSLLLDLIMLLIPHFLMHISKLTWEVWVEEPMEAHLIILILNPQICHHTIQKHHQGHQEPLPIHLIFQNQVLTIIANIQLLGLLETIPTLLNLVQQHKIKSFLQKDKQLKKSTM